MDLSETGRERRNRRGSSLCQNSWSVRGGRKCHRKWIPPLWFRYKYGNSILARRISLTILIFFALLNDGGGRVGQTFKWTRSRIVLKFLRRFKEQISKRGLPGTTMVFSALCPLSKNNNKLLFALRHLTCLHKVLRADWSLARSDWFEKSEQTNNQDASRKPATYQRLLFQQQTAHIWIRPSQSNAFSI